MTRDKKKKENHPTFFQSTISKQEEKTLLFWLDRKIFERTLTKPAPKGEFIFYDGPPFANGLPHYGHILAGTIKDVIPRYQTMRGFRVPRRWGWDCHGLPVENLVEKELGLKNKKDVERLGVETFNAAARRSVMRFADEWRRQVPRFGRFVDMTNDYRTMDTAYTETVWWIFKNLYDKGLIYEGFKSMHLCPRCETTLSNFEVTQNYREIKDLSVTVKFKLEDPSKLDAVEETFVLAWTTTPWTLPANVALAVNRQAIYCLIRNVRVKGQNSSSAGADSLRQPTASSLKSKGENFVLAKERLSTVLKDYDYEVVREFTGDKLVGLAYEPLFDYYVKDAKLKNRERGWRIYAADFVTLGEGTGVVHLAPAFGDDDYNLSLKENLPFIQHVGANGLFDPSVRDFSGLAVKPKSNPQETDQKIVFFLRERHKVFSTEVISHPYPHCWRCETPLLNYAASSWFVRVTALREQLVSANEKIKWVPAAIGQYRFGHWLAEARDWSISRSRFWGAPLPVWRCNRCAGRKVVGAITDLAKQSNNRIFVMRHGEAAHNIAGVADSGGLTDYHLTERGEREARAAVEALAKQGVKIDLIYSSPLTRARETAKLAAEVFGILPDAVLIDKRLTEIDFGHLNGQPIAEYQSRFPDSLTRFEAAPQRGENFSELKRRLGDFIFELDSRYHNRNVLLISHGSPAAMLLAAARLANREETLRILSDEPFSLAEIRPVVINRLPRNSDYELDLHRPFIDEVVFQCACGGVMKRVPEVFDCWFESGAMPYGSWHYPFENLDKFQPAKDSQKRVGFPADFIAEGLDQTRGWFYSLLVLGIALFGESPYRRVVVNGTILAADGAKMSKRLQNYPDPLAIVNRYSADALRFYLLSSPAVRGEELCFLEAGVAEVYKKVFQRLANVLEFYKIYQRYQPLTSLEKPRPTLALDRWILARFNQLVEEVTNNLERYELDRAARPITVFIDDLSTWYLRRSRERIKQQTIFRQQTVIQPAVSEALTTLRYVLTQLSKVLAPFAPFFAEYLYQQVEFSANDCDWDQGGYSRAPEKTEDQESVHLLSWPSVEQVTPDVESLLAEMEEVRRIVSLALEARAKVNIRVRQPLASLKIKSQKFKLSEDLSALIKEEVNVKEVLLDGSIKDEVEIDQRITPDLREEGLLREVVRFVQDLRKKNSFQAGEPATLIVVATGVAADFIQRHKDKLSQAAALNDVVMKTASETLESGELFQIADWSITFKLSRDQFSH
jgi:isoleucyl-tRNA synthetase